MKNILIVCPCSLRGDSIGLIAELLSQFKTLRTSGFTFDLLDTNYYQKHDREKYDVNEYYSCYRNTIIDRIVKKLPVVRSKYAEKIYIEKFKSIIRKKNYDFVLFYKVPSFSDILIYESHRAGAKTILYPWGSEVLRASKAVDKHLYVAYSNVDYVLGFEKSNLNKKAIEVYKVPKSKIIELKPIFRTIKEIKEIPSGWDRKKMSEVLGIPESNYNVVCGYSGCETQRHVEMIKAISKNKKSLPKDYQLIFPVTYVAQADYVQKLQSLCKIHGLNAIFLTSYMSNKQIACLHLLTDLFINIQPTDAGNLFMIEALYCKNQIITGKWLNYDQFEQFGVPYYSLNTLNDLSSFLSDLFSGKIKKVSVPNELVAKYDYPDNNNLGIFWMNLFCEKNR